MFADQSVSNWAIRNDSSAFFKALKPVRRGGKLFAGKYVVPPIAAVYVLGIAFKNQDMRDFVTGCMTSWAAQSYGRKAVAYAFGRARPDTTGTPDVSPNNPHIWKLGGGWGDWNMRSFPGGHFANAMSCATFWNERFRLGAAGPVLYALAAAVGVGRLGDDAHWFSDQLIGGIFGYAVGREVARRSLRRSRGLPHSPVLGVSSGPNGPTVSFNWTF
jgi:membrane-associated phospholipid phosphatase